MTDSDDRQGEFRPDIPSPARVYNYILGGKDHYPADRVVAENTMAAIPSARDAALENRGFLRRAARYLAAEAGLRQFLDIGTGLPSNGQVHEVVQGIAPESRVVYVDNDPVVLAHGRDMLHGVDGTTILRHDLRDPDSILGDPELHRLLDFDRPVALLLVAVLHFVADSEDPDEVVRRLMKPLPPGSHLVISHGTDDGDDDVEKALEENYKTSSSAHVRTRPRVEAFFDDLELIEPGVVWTPIWRPDGASSPLFDDPARSVCYAGVARKP
ncbi:SAM-dependent methyltransferase [Actinoallomurus purpureus]|uniref:SAM-dependent methyltransferase n=1 Tax=Actinoallomurus purpureus TaxID=478114 RepID=UPI0020932DBF|nr:SAM-dependent methyltransferase [Actinoallomurus purpureus]MCO6005273.1 SAM-dependent methyltransferase [Actinoallomurus purpureus]